MNRPTSPFLDQESPASSRRASYTNLHDFDHQAEPLLPASNSQIVRPRGFSLFRTTTTRKRTNLFLFLCFVGIVIVSARVWKDIDIEASSHGIEAQLKEWREYYWAAESAAPDGLGLGWGGTKDAVDVREDSTRGDLLQAGAQEQASSSDSENSSALENADPTSIESLEEDLSTTQAHEEVDDDEEQEEEAEEEESGTATKLNVRPVTRSPSKDPSVKYLSFENHSGFHNQRKSLVNALVLARLLNRTLLLPPARLGTPQPWGPGLDLTWRLVFSEECKAGIQQLPIAPHPDSVQISQRTLCDDPKLWTYVAWDWLIDPKLFAGRQLVDRWNSSRAVFTASLNDGGLGLEPEDIHAFEDNDRRSYQIYDSRDTPTDLALFTSRLDLQDLLEGTLAEKRLLQFGSLFSGSRLNLAKEENRRDYEKTFNGVILNNTGLDAISDEVRDRLGSYIAVHARTGSRERSSVFWRDANSRMTSIFRKVTHSVLGIKAKEVDRLVREVSKQTKRSLRPRRSFVSNSTFPPTWDDDEEAENAESPVFRPHLVPRSLDLTARAHSGHLAKPLAPSLHCRKPLWPANDKTLSRLNIPLYLATDSPSPAEEPSLKIFYEYFPCLFVLSDFISPTPGVSDESVPALERLVNGDKEWISDFDGLNLATFLYPFLEAEIAARGVEVVGTKGSTFSSFASGILHEHYDSRGWLAPWDRR
ncbi:uncharacterized protein JCM6883_005545 [Sporobolomyces salmoneus]|uniref:uncharacterized protein n=1 Tax=Sporobolomyces salmoneus TaxID=183962 RepID=UPI00316EA981